MQAKEFNRITTARIMRGQRRVSSEELSSTEEGGPKAKVAGTRVAKTLPAIQDAGKSEELV